jgi:hypothetical protein
LNHAPIGIFQDELIKHSSNWHKEGGHSVRPEDVVVAAFVQLRRIAVRPHFLT